MTTAMSKVDAKNVIKGNKDKDTDLYEQLEKTSSFDVSELRKRKKFLFQESEEEKTKNKK